MYSEEILVNNKQYKLQHPGNREWTKIKSSLMKPGPKGVGIDLEPLLDYFFENVVIPDGPGVLKLSLDGPLDENGRASDLSPAETKAWLTECQEVWSTIAIPFFRGELESPYIWPKDKQAK